MNTFPHQSPTETVLNKSIAAAKLSKLQLCVWRTIFSAPGLPGASFSINTALLASRRERNILKVPLGCRTTSRPHLRVSCLKSQTKTRGSTSPRRRVRKWTLHRSSRESMRLQRIVRLLDGKFEFQLTLIHSVFSFKLCPKFQLVHPLYWFRFRNVENQQMVTPENNRVSSRRNSRRAAADLETPSPSSKN